MDFTELKKPVMINISCVGEKTGIHYEGKFLCKRFLTQADKAKFALREECLCNGTPRMPRYELRDVALSIKDALPNISNDDLTKVVWNIAVIIPPESSEIADLRLLAKVQTHIIDAADWWKQANNGEDLPDMAPVQAINYELTKLQIVYAQHQEKGNVTSHENSGT